MNENTWVIGGGVIIVAIAALLFFTSGNNITQEETSIVIPPSEITIDGQNLATSTAENIVVDINQSQSNKMELSTNTGKTAVLHTSMGDITIKFYAADAPKTVENFLKLSTSGFYDGVKFHRVIKGFMNQTGDPLSKDDAMSARWGTGDPGYKFADEINPASSVYVNGYKHGIVAMANSGPNTNGSQFFIMAADYPLPSLYTIFGEVTSGLDVVDKINAVQTSQDRPLTPVIINSVEVR